MADAPADPAPLREMLKDEKELRPNGAENTNREAVRSASPQQEKHTPGPWEVKYVIDGAFQIAAAEDGDFVVIAARNPVPGRHAEFVANAHLIAAAPSMLIALKQIREHCPADPDTTRRLNVAWALLEAAIAKAEGL